MAVVYLGRPRQSQLGVSGQVIASIINGVVTVAMATVQIVLQEIREGKARRKWRHDQARARDDALVQADELRRRNDELQAYLDSLMGGGNGLPGSVTGITPGGFWTHPYFPYVVLGGGMLIGLMVLARRRREK